MTVVVLGTIVHCTVSDTSVILSTSLTNWGQSVLWQSVERSKVVDWELWDMENSCSGFFIGLYVQHMWFLSQRSSFEHRYCSVICMDEYLANPDVVWSTHYLFLCEYEWLLLQKNWSTGWFNSTVFSPNFFLLYFLSWAESESFKETKLLPDVDVQYKLN